MNIGCLQCASIFRVDPAKVPTGGVRARCSVCGAVIPVPEPTSADRAEATAASARTHFRQPTPATGVPMFGSPPYAALTAETHTPSGAWPGSPSGAQRLGPETPALPIPAPAGAKAATAAKAAPTARAGAKAAAPSAPRAGKAAAPTPSGSHLNPYLARDPQQRARRLARALISDIVTYYPDKHAQALRDGSIRDTFSEEVKKSYEDYVTQVGAELAETTTYFQDALNELLAGGAKVF